MIVIFSAIGLGMFVFIGDADAGQPEEAAKPEALGHGYTREGDARRLSKSASFIALASNEADAEVPRQSSSQCPSVTGVKE